MRSLTFVFFALLFSCSSQDDRDTQQQPTVDARSDTSFDRDALSEEDASYDSAEEMDAVSDITTPEDVVDVEADSGQDAEASVADVVDQDALSTKKCKIIKTDSALLFSDHAWTSTGFAASDQVYITVDNSTSYWLVNVIGLNGEKLWELPTMEVKLGPLNYMYGSPWGFTISANSDVRRLAKLDSSATQIPYMVDDPGDCLLHDNGGTVISSRLDNAGLKAEVLLADIDNQGIVSNQRSIYVADPVDGYNMNGAAISDTSTGVLFQPFTACCGNPWMEQRMLLLIENGPSSVAVVDYGKSDPQGSNRPSTFLHLFSASTGFLVHWMDFVGDVPNMQRIDEISHQGVKLNTRQIPSKILPVSLAQFGNGFAGLALDDVTQKIDIIILNNDAMVQQIIPTPYLINANEPRFIRAITASPDNEHLAVAFCQDQATCNGIALFLECF